MSLSFVGWLARVDKSAKGVKFRHLPLAHHVVWEDEYAAYMIASNAPTPKHCKVITSQNSTGLSRLESTTPTPICICIARRLLNNFNAINANANITGNNINETGIRVLARD